MALRKRGIIFKICFREREVPRKGGGEVPSEKGDSNPAGNCDVFMGVLKFFRAAVL